ncbi:MAG: hypothetical protein ACFFFG_18070 [Candidatus Thorarchaeota archaeon]
MVSFDVDIYSEEATIVFWGFIGVGLVLFFLGVFAPILLFIGLPLLLSGLWNLLRLESERSKIVNKYALQAPGQKKAKTPRFTRDLQKGLKEYEEENYATAARILTRVIENPNTPMKHKMIANSLVARCLAQREKWAAARLASDDFFKTALLLGINPPYLDYIARVTIYLNLGIVKEAYSTLQIAINYHGAKRELRRLQQILIPLISDAAGDLPMVCPKCGTQYEKGKVPTFCFVCNQLFLQEQM